MIRRLHVPVTKPEDVIPHLAKQEAHWKAGYSAEELAVAWANAGNDFPKRVRAVLETAPEYKGVELIDGFFEREVYLGTAGRKSQTDVPDGLRNVLSPTVREAYWLASCELAPERELRHRRHRISSNLRVR